MLKGFRKGREHLRHGTPPNNIQGTVLLAIPTVDFKLDILTVAGLMQVLAWGGGKIQPFFQAGTSNIRDARNHIAQYFLTKTKHDHCVWIDSDMGFSLADFRYLMEGPEDLVVAPYAKKKLGAPHNDFGFGFVRTHRRVFESLMEWTTPEGEPCLQQYMMEGELAWDFFIDGAQRNLQWLGEDTGFFHLCAVRGIQPRRESRARLVHVGRLEYGYPDQLVGYVPPEAGAQ